MMSTREPSAPISLLIVEDCKLTLNCYAVFFSMQFSDVTIYTAIDGITGLELFTAHLPDIVVTDFNMPEMDGMQMARKIRAIKPETKLIILTGDKDSLGHTCPSTNEYPYDHLIEKPVEFMELSAAIKQCIGEISGR